MTALHSTAQHEYWVWAAMVQRCTNPECKGFPNYGGRGIKVCDRWRRFKYFLEDIGRRPHPKSTIERLDNNADYEPANCKWAERLTNNRNKRRYKTNLTGVAGVREEKNGRFRARIRVEGLLINLGRFATLESAADARRAKEQEIGFGRTHGVNP